MKKASKKGTTKITGANVADKIKAAKEKLKGAEKGAGLRAAKKKVKRLQRAKRKLSRETKRNAPKAEAAPKA